MKRFLMLCLPLCLLLLPACGDNPGLFGPQSGYCADMGPNSTLLTLGYNDQYIVFQTRTSLSYCTGSDEKKYKHHTFSYGISSRYQAHHAYESDDKTVPAPSKLTPLIDEPFRLLDHNFQQLSLESSQHRFTFMENDASDEWDMEIDLIIESKTVDQNDPEKTVYTEINRFTIGLNEYYDFERFE